MKKIESHKVPQLKEPQRLSDYLPGKFLSISSRKGIKKAIEKKLVHVNGSAGRTSKYINGGEEIILYESKVELRKPIIDIPMDIIYEDEHMAIINKPPGLVVSGNKLRTVENALPNLLQKSNEIDGLLRPHPAHRLDFPTSGLLIIGKTRSSVTALNLLFEKRQISKTYLAVTIGDMKATEGRIENSIRKKSAVTEYKCLYSVDSKKFEKLNLVELSPVTGRRHQLRIHMHENGNSLLGDNTYFIEGKKSIGNGLYLHAYSLSFQHPISKSDINVTAPLPPKFTKIFGKENTIAFTVNKESEEEE